MLGLHQMVGRKRLLKTSLPDGRPEGKDLWLGMDSGQTQYSSPFVTEVKGDAAEPAEEPIAYWGEPLNQATQLFVQKLWSFNHQKTSLCKPVTLSPRQFRKPE